jgi:hypothetical protein
MSKPTDEVRDAGFADFGHGHPKHSKKTLVAFSKYSQPGSHKRRNGMEQKRGGDTRSEVHSLASEIG